MAGEQKAGVGVAAGTSKLTAAQKRSLAKSQNAEALAKLPDGHQHMVKVLRRAKGTIEASIDAIMSGKQPVAGLGLACANLEIACSEMLFG